MGERWEFERKKHKCVGQREDVGVKLGAFRKYCKGKDYKEMIKETAGPRC